MLLGLFRGTSVANNMEAERDRITTGSDPGDDWEALANLIEETAAAVSRKTGLREHLRKTSTLYARYDLAIDEILPAGRPLMVTEPLAHAFEVHEQFPPIPSTILFEELLVPRFERVLSFPKGENSGSPQGDLTVEVSVWREVRLAIGPADQIETPRALFEVRTRVDLSSDGELVAVRRPWFYLKDESPEQVEVLLDDGDVVEALINLGPPKDADLGLRKANAAFISFLPEEYLSWVPLQGPLQFEHVYAIWYPVTAENTTNLLSRSAHGDPSDNRPEIRLHLHDIVTETRVPEGTVGALLETSLLGDEQTIQAALIERALQLVNLVEHYAVEKRHRALEKHESVIARLRSGQ